MRLPRGRRAAPQTLPISARHAQVPTPPEPGGFFICYLDESGITDLTAGTTHYILVGLAIPIETWQGRDREITGVKAAFSLQDIEIHSGWMTRRYLEQERIPNFVTLGRDQRRTVWNRERDATLIRIAATRPAPALLEAKRNFRKTEPYTHLTRDERMDVLRRLASLIGSWADCRLFFEAAEKNAYRGRTDLTPIEEASFTQVVSRLQFFLTNRGRNLGRRILGMLVQDNNETVAMKLTKLMRQFHERGTTYTVIPDIVETPLFVDSSLTSMVQLADICAYATRRFFENAETDLFDRVYVRTDRSGGRVVGGRHYTGVRQCRCRVCVDHGRSP